MSQVPHNMNQISAGTWKGEVPTFIWLIRLVWTQQGFGSASASPLKVAKKKKKKTSKGKRAVPAQQLCRVGKGAALVTQFGKKAVRSGEDGQTSRKGKNEKKTVETTSSTVDTRFLTRNDSYLDRWTARYLDRRRAR